MAEELIDLETTAKHGDVPPEVEVLDKVCGLCVFCRFANV
jgi:hypothetical protein